MAREEDRVAVGEDDDGHEGDADPGAVWLTPPTVGKSLAVEALDLAGTVEEDVRRGHHNIIDDASGGGKVDKPCENLCRAVRDLEEREDRETHGDGKAVDRHARFGAFPQDLGGSSFEGQAVQAASGTESVSVTGGEDAGH